jgi:hypothetical protein
MNITKQQLNGIVLGFLTTDSQILKHDVFTVNLKAIWVLWGKDVGLVHK